MTLRINRTEYLKPSAVAHKRLFYDINNLIHLALVNWKVINFGFDQGPQSDLKMWGLKPSKAKQRESGAQLVETMPL